jgi:hypothetical protein
VAWIITQYLGLQNSSLAGIILLISFVFAHLNVWCCIDCQVSTFFFLGYFQSIYIYILCEVSVHIREHVCWEWTMVSPLYYE